MKFIKILLVSFPILYFLLQCQNFGKNPESEQNDSQISDTVMKNIVFENEVLDPEIRASDTLKLDYITFIETLLNESDALDEEEKVKFRKELLSFENITPPEIEKTFQKVFVQDLTVDIKRMKFKTKEEYVNFTNKYYTKLDFVRMGKKINEGLNPESPFIFEEFNSILKMVNTEFRRKFRFQNQLYLITDSVCIEKQIRSIKNDIVSKKYTDALTKLKLLAFATNSLNPNNWESFRNERIEKLLLLFKNLAKEKDRDLYNEIIKCIKIQRKLDVMGTQEELIAEQGKFIVDYGFVFHEGELPNINKPDWLMLQNTEINNIDSLIKVKLTVKKERDPLLDEVEGADPTGEKIFRNGKTTEHNEQINPYIPRAISGYFKPALYFKDIPGINAGCVKKAHFIQTIPNYLMAITGTDTLSIVIHERYEAESMPILLRKINNYTIYENRPENVFVIWAGDLDNNGLIDVVLKIQPSRNTSEYCLFMSIRDNGSIQFNKIATFNTQAD